MNIKAIFSDIDGTLLNSQHKITPSTKEAIQNLQKKKYQICPCFWSMSLNNIFNTP